MSKSPTTKIATHTADDVFVRGKSLCDDLIGKLTFTEMTYFHLLGTMPTPAQTAVLDASLVTLMEHGLTPSVVATRLVYTSAPEAMQGAVAAGILAVGSLFVGTVEGAAQLLTRIVSGDGDGEAEARRVVAEHRAQGKHVPGFGHPVHKPDDPRPGALFRVAEAHGIAGRHVAALKLLAAAVDDAAGKHVTINATGAIAAVLLDASIPSSIMRGLAILARCAGLVGHIHEEQSSPAMRAMWEAAERAVPHEP
ncbi:MAG: citryl-CoA lyase [Labilithrix sp.]|nr:citryl-CoA lyase [Labilithrix sp.]